MTDDNIIDEFEFSSFDDLELTSFNIYDEEEIHRDVEYTYLDEDGLHYIPHAVVQIWRNSVTGAESVGWWAIEGGNKQGDFDNLQGGNE